MCKHSSLATILLLVGFVGCKDDETPNQLGSAQLEVDFTGMVGTAPLALESVTYAAPGVAEGFRLTRLSFFLSDIQLLTDVGAGELKTDVAEVAYLELGPNGRAALEVADVPVGNYTGIRFNLGLTPEQDALQPKDYAPAMPLAKSSEYWVDWGSYIFLKIEGKVDTLADGKARFDHGFVYHVGKSAEYTQRITVTTPFEVSATGAELPLRVDLSQLLGLEGSDPLSLKRAMDHRNTAARRLMDNAKGAFTRDR